MMDYSFLRRRHWIQRMLDLQDTIVLAACIGAAVFVAVLAFTGNL